MEKIFNREIKSICDTKWKLNPVNLSQCNKIYFYINNTDKYAFFTFYKICALSAERIIRYGDDHGKFQW